MSNVVLGYPKISQADFDWIQGIRETHDRQYEIVKPHVTFVFPTTKLAEVELIGHVRQKVTSINRFTISLSKALVVEDDSKKFFHTFLVPSEGYDEIITLHDLLYTDALLSELRADIPFIPHLGIASHEDESTMRALADELNATGVNINGLIDELTISGFDGKRVHDIAKAPLHEM